MFSLIFVISLTLAFSTSQNEVVSETQPNATATKVVIWVLGNSAGASQLDPAGLGRYGTLYVARARVDGEWIPGKGYYRGGAFEASVPFMGKEIETTDCQALLGGGTKWVPQQKYRQIPPRAVFAGLDPRTHARTYVCRAYMSEGGQQWLTVGKILENDRMCKLPFYGERDAYAFEVLVET